MKTRYALALASLLLVPAVQAAPPGGAAATPATPAAQSATPPPQAGMGKGPMMMEDGSPMMMMRDDLKLTDEQKPKVQAIFQEAKVKHEAIRKETHDKLAGVLTPEQMKKLDEHREMKMDKRGDRMEKRKEKMKERQGGQ